MKNTINKAKAVVAAILVVVMATLTSCYQKFEESWDLAVNGPGMTLPSGVEEATAFEENVTAVPIFTTGHWTAQLDRDIVWGYIEETSGNGTSYIHFHYTKNTSVSRSVNLVLRANGKEEIIRLVQKSGIGSGAVAFDRSDVTYANGKYEGRLEIKTNLPNEAFADAAPILTLPNRSEVAEGETTEGEGEESAEPTLDWITDVVYHPAEVIGTDDEGHELKSTPYITFTIQPNTTGADRVAVMKYGLTDAAGTEYYATATLTQEAAAGYITLNETTITRDEQAGVRVAVDTNLTEFIDDMVTSVNYQTENAEGYISNIKMTSTSATFDVAANESTKRIATISVSYTDLDGNVTTGSLRVIQRGETIKRAVTAESVREQLTAAGEFIYASVNDDTNDYADVLELRVITDASSLNTETNTNTAWNKTPYTPTETTGYAQTEDGKLGFRLQFIDAASNTLKGFSKIELPLDGKKIVREDNPTRYTITGLTDKDIVMVAEGTIADLASKSRTIATLKDEDIYTYVSLTDTEFAVKDGPYTYNVESMVASGSHGVRDELATMITDQEHNAIFALINSKCSWRRDLTNGTIKAPAGVGTTSGVIVHSKNPSYGNIGTYQIRPLDQTSFDMPEAEAFSTNVLAAWRLTKATVSVGQYKWNNGGAFVYATQNAGGQTNFNQMHPTHGEITDYSASLYSTNRTVVESHNVGYASESKTALHNRTYHPTIVDGCKSTHKTWTGTTNADPTCCSRATALGFWGDVASYYEWNEQGNWTGKTTGIVMEFPTTAASGKMSVQFSMGSLAYGRTDNANKITMAQKLRSATFGFPLYWKVECSIDGGATWTACTNAVNGEQQFKMSPTLHYLDGKSYSITDFLTGTSLTPQTPLEHCPGFVQQKFILPANAAGAAKVMLKISPASLRLAAYSGNDYTSAIDVPGHDCTKSYSYSHALVLEDVVVSYK